MRTPDALPPYSKKGAHQCVILSNTQNHSKSAFFKMRENFESKQNCYLLVQFATQL